MSRSGLEFMVGEEREAAKINIERPKREKREGPSYEWGRLMYPYPKRTGPIDSEANKQAADCEGFSVC
jgi:hypothetical protein